MIQRFTNEYIKLVRSVAQEYATHVSEISCVMLVALDLESERVYTIIDLPEYDGLNREDWIEGKPSKRESVYEYEREYLYLSEARIGARLTNINDYPPNNDWILYHVPPTAEILYARTK